MKTLSLLVVIFCQPLAASRVGGDIAASFTFLVGSDFSGNFFGNGITINLPDIFTPGGGSEQALCVSDCEFAGLLNGNEGGSASIGAITSASFSFDFLESGSSGDFIGSLTLFQPFTMNILGSISLETFLVGAAVSNGLPEHVETDFQFSPNPFSGPGGGASPEPDTLTLITLSLIGIGSVSLLKSLRLSGIQRRTRHN